MGAGGRHVGAFVEGWAVYAEELMTGFGFGGLPVKLQQLKMQLRMTINALLDQLVHCEGLPKAEAMKLMMERGFQEEGEAAGKWRRALLTSTQLSTYFVGYSELAEVAALRPQGVSRRDWNDEMLAHDCPRPVIACPAGGLTGRFAAPAGRTGAGGLC